MNIHLSHLKIYNFNIHIILTIVLGRPESSCRLLKENAENFNLINVY